MPTTLRIDDKLYRAAKVAAASEGITLTRFLEEAIRNQLKNRTKKKRMPHTFFVYSGDRPFPYSPSELKRIAEEEQEKYDLAKLGLVSNEAS
jgi:hypothetical protein